RFYRFFFNFLALMDIRSEVGRNDSSRFPPSGRARGREPGGHLLHFLPMQNRCSLPRRSSRPRETAGVAITPSPTVLLPNSSNFGAAGNTDTSPFSVTA